MTVTSLNIPQGVPSDGNVKVAFVPDGGIADLAEPSVTEVTAVSAQDLSCYMFAIGEGVTEDRKQKRRLCSKEKYELLGATTYTVDDLSYVYDVQDPEGVTNAAYAALVPGTTGYLVIRWGLDADDAFAIGDIVDIFPVRLGAQRKQTPEENDELTVMQSLVVTGNKSTDVALVA